MNKELISRIIEALEIGCDSALNDAINYHLTMAGYRQSQHEAYDRDVELIKSVLEEVKLIGEKL